MGKKGDNSDRRRYQRVPLSLLIQYRFDNLDEFLAEYSTDISIGGMFIRTEEIREEGSLIYLQFYLKDGSKLIEGLGKVVRVNRPDPDGKNRGSCGMGIEFVNFDQNSMQLIEQIVERNLSRARKNETS